MRLFMDMDMAMACGSAQGLREDHNARVCMHPCHSWQRRKSCGPPAGAAEVHAATWSGLCWSLRQRYLSGTLVSAWSRRCAPEKPAKRAHVEHNVPRKKLTPSTCSQGSRPACSCHDCVRPVSSLRLGSGSAPRLSVYGAGCLGTGGPLALRHENFPSRDPTCDRARKSAANRPQVRAP